MEDKASLLLNHDSDLEKDTSVGKSPMNCAISPSEAVSNHAARKKGIEQKFNEIAKLKDRIYEVRFDTSLGQVELRHTLQAMLNDLASLEEEYRALCRSDYSRMADSLNLAGIGMESAFPNQLLTTDQGRRTSTLIGMRPKSAAESAAQNWVNLAGTRRSFVGTSTSVPRQEGNSAAMQNWGSVLGVVQSALQWKKYTEGKKFTEAENILENENVKITKEEILKLRRTLYILRQKKNQTLSEKNLKKNLEERLKELEEQLKEAMREIPL